VYPQRASRNLHSFYICAARHDCLVGAVALHELYSQEGEPTIRTKARSLSAEIGAPNSAGFQIQHANIPFTPPGNEAKERREQTRWQRPASVQWTPRLPFPTPPLFLCCPSCCRVVRSWHCCIQYDSHVRWIQKKKRLEIYWKSMRQ
jgi:hypothetical protein